MKESGVGWSEVGNDAHHQPAPPAPAADNGGWEETPSGGMTEDSWATQSDTQWNQPSNQLNNDGKKI